MATINSRKLVDELIAKNGRYSGDAQVVKIVQYNNMFDGGLAYGLIYKGEPLNRYDNCAGSNQKCIWEAKK